MLPVGTVSSSTLFFLSEIAQSTRQHSLKFQLGYRVSPMRSPTYEDKLHIGAFGMGMQNSNQMKSKIPRAPVIGLIKKSLLGNLA